MESRMQRLAPILGALGVLLILAAFFGAVFFPSYRSILLLGGGLGIILVAIFLFTRPREELREAITGRVTLYGTNTLVMSIVFIAIIGLVNYLAGQQLHARWDLTANKQNTLSEQTINVLKNLNQPVQITGFFTPQMYSTQIDAENLLKEYTLHSSQITYKMIDPVQNPAAAQAYNVVSDGTLIFQRGDRQEKVYNIDEGDFTNALLKVTQTKQPAVYFITGHGEMSPNDTNQNGLSSIKTYLEQTNYKVDVLNLAAVTTTETISGGVPADTSALVIADPTKPIPVEDEAKLKAYLANGGRLLIMVNPDSDPGLKDLLNTYGLQLNNDLVLDPARNYRGFSAYPVITDFPASQITSNLQSYGVFLPGARSIKEVGKPENKPDMLFRTSPEACGKTDLAALKDQSQLQCDPAKDEKGPFILGYSVEIPQANADKKPGRLIVIGNANFASNQIMQSPDGEGDRQLVVNMINWLAGQEQLIAIPPKQPNNTAIRAMSNEDVAFVALSNVAIIPLALLALGGLVWWRRR